MSTDLNENMTSEDIKSYADTLVKEIEQERQGDRKSDAEIVASTSQPTKTTAEPNSGSQSAEVDDQGEESSQATAPEWLTDDVKAEVAAYGIEESDLSDFASREELDRVLRLLDKTALESGRKALAESEKPTTRNEKGQFTKQEESAPELPGEQSTRADRYEVSLSKDLFDEEIIDEFTKMRDYYESRLQSVEARFQEVSIQSEEQRFDNIVDSLGHADLFGKTGKESEKELERRKDLMVAVKAQTIGLERLGRPAEMTDQLVARVANMVFADEFAKKRLKQQTAKISKQSNLRMGGSPTKPQPLSEDPREAADRLYRELERS